MIGGIAGFTGASWLARFVEHQAMGSGRDEPPPPWVVSGSPTPVGDTHWRDPAAKAWLKGVFLPFYDQLDAPAQEAYWRRWGAPQAWWTMFLHPDLDALFAEADGDNAPAAQNFREEWLG